MRRSQHAISVCNIVASEDDINLRHHVSKNGVYKGKKVLDIKEKKDKKEKVKNTKDEKIIEQKAEVEKVDIKK